MIHVKWLGLTITLGSLMLIIVSNKLLSIISRLHTILCWMNEKYTNDFSLPSHAFDISSCQSTQDITFFNLYCIFYASWKSGWIYPWTLSLGSCTFVLSFEHARHADAIRLLLHILHINLIRLVSSNLYCISKSMMKHPWKSKAWKK